jgi:hypothetical protein
LRSSFEIYGRPFFKRFSAARRFRVSSSQARASSAEMAKAARLNSKRFRRPAATRIGELRYAEKVLSV